MTHHFSQPATEISGENVREVNECRRERERVRGVNECTREGGEGGEA